MTPARTVGIIGLGTLGKPMAKNLVKAGFDVAVNDIRPEPVQELSESGASACATPAEMAPRCEVVISMLLNIKQTETVLYGRDGLLGSMQAGSKLVIGSTLGPDAMLKITDAFREKSVVVVDAAVTGGYPSAEQGTLTVLVGAEQDVFEDVLPVLRAVGSRIIRTGPVGSAQVAKLASNLILSINILALLEGLELGMAGGLTPASLKEIFRQTTARSYPLEVWDELGSRWKRMLARFDESRSEIPLAKDLRLAEHFAAQHGVSLVLGSEASAIWNGTNRTAYSDPIN